MNDILKRNYKRCQPVPGQLVLHNKLWALQYAKLSKRVGNRRTVLAIYREVVL